MSVRTVVCPGCGSGLRSNKPVSDSRILHCPRCSHSFSVAETNPFRNEILTDELRDPIPPVLLTRRLFPLAALLTAILAVLGGGIGFLMWANQHKGDAGNETKATEDPLAREKKRLAEREKELQEKEAKLALDRKKIQFDKLVADGETALNRDRYSEAEKWFSQALDLFPEDVSARSGLAKAKAGLLASNQVGEDKEKRKAEYGRLMVVGKEKMTDKQYAAAVLAFQQAANLLVGDPAANKALAEAQTALGADASQKKKLELFTAAMEKGRAAMVAQRYQDALDAYQNALVLIPNNLDAMGGVRDAQRGLDDAKKLKGDQVAYQQAMTRGNNAMNDRKANLAVASFEQALVIMPGDTAATAALKQAKQLQVEVKAQLNRLLQLGDGAMAAGRIEEAIRNYQNALSVAPDDPVATSSLQRAQSVLNDAAASQVAYLRYMNQGRVAMRAKLFADAVIAFGEAVRIAPLDADALQGLKEARRAVDLQLKAKQDVDRLLATATQAIGQQLWGDAVKALNAASQINPDDIRILPLLRKARYNLNMADGQIAFLAKRWADAAFKFDAALQDNPGDPLARAKRDQAKALIK